MNYFGYWLSSLERGNELQFYSKGTKTFDFSATDIHYLIFYRQEYKGNPTYNPRENPYGRYVFVNFFCNNCTFDEVHFMQNVTDPLGHDSDNHTVGYFREISGEIVAMNTTTTPDTTSTTTPTTTSSATLTTTLTTTTAATTEAKEPGGGVSTVVIVGSATAGVAALAAGGGIFAMSRKKDRHVKNGSEFSWPDVDGPSVDDPDVLTSVSLTDITGMI